MGPMALILQGVIIVLSEQLDVERMNLVREGCAFPLSNHDQSEHVRSRLGNITAALR